MKTNCNIEQTSPWSVARPSAGALRTIISASLLMALLVLGSPSVLAQNLHEQAEQQIRSGDIPGMAETYLKILEKNPRDVKARLGYATAHSWLGNHELAQRQFKEVLAMHPENLDALSGLGYDHAWAGQFRDAERLFRKGLSLAPDNIGIQKGLAFTYLWSKQPGKALDALNSLEKNYPDDAEIQAARGQALAALGKDEAAATAFNNALKIEPGREDASNGLAALEQKSVSFDISAWYGNTSDGGDSGLREVVLGYNTRNNSRLWFRFDDSLSLDNPALARSGQKAETIYLGLQSPLQSTWLGIFEIGNRDLPANADQQIYKFEAVNIQSPKFYKIGVQVSPHSDNFTDKLIYTSFGYPLNKSWRFEPALFLSSSGAIDDKELRAVVFAEYVDPRLWTLGLGAGVGRISSDNAAAEGDVLTSNALFSYPLNRKTRLNLSVRYEDTPTNSFSTALIGIALQLP